MLVLLVSRAFSNQCNPYQMWVEKQDGCEIVLGHTLPHTTLLTQCEINNKYPRRSPKYLESLEEKSPKLCQTFHPRTASRYHNSIKYSGIQALCSSKTRGKNTQINIYVQNTFYPILFIFPAVLEKALGT